MTLLAILSVGMDNCAEGSWTVLCEEHFSADPGWTTNDPANLQWDPLTQTYHGMQVNIEGTYAFKTIAGFDANQSWQLDFNARNNSCGWSAGRDVGLFDHRLGVGGWPCADAAQGIADGGHGTALYYPGSGISTYNPGWALGVWYHQRLAYDATSSQLSLVVTETGSETPVWTLTAIVPTFPAEMNRIGVSRAWMKDNYAGVDPWASVDFNIDDIVLSVVPEPSSLVLLAGLAALGLRRR